MYYKARKPVELNPAQTAQVDALALALPKLSASDARFASDLIGNFRTWGKLSEKQMVWVDTLTQRAAQPAAEAVPVIQVNVQKIQDLFSRAAQKMRRIKVALQTAGGQSVVFTRAGQNSKYAGQIMLTDGAPFGMNKFFGRIDTNGDFVPTRRAVQEVQNLVVEFANDPEAVAGKYGRLTGSCCFCCRPLKDERSTQVGYGPVCASRFGVNWG
jgi:hypothetical protein